jgi:enoyl-[acyl-carrier protein] reductase I
MYLNHKKWAVILGGTGSFGLSSAKLLASKGYNLILIYRERKNKLAALNSDLELLKEQCNLIEFNLNANENQNLIIETLLKRPELQNSISFILHAIADGNLKPMFKQSENQDLTLNSQDFSHTIESMGTSLYNWTKLLLDNKLLSNKASIVGLTSEGTFKYFKDYAAVASAKSVLETTVRYMAIELVPFGIRANIINAGITDSKALKVFPDYEKFITKAKERNPHGRLTTPEDVAKVIAFLASDDSEWINGSVITVDGGEQLISLF